MFKEQRGKCLIINVPSVRGDPRSGYEVDGSRLKHLFQELHFDVTLHDKASSLKGYVGTQASPALLYSTLLAIY